MEFIPIIIVSLVVGYIVGSYKALGVIAVVAALVIVVLAGNASVADTSDGDERGLFVFLASLIAGVALLAGALGVSIRKRKP